MLKIILIERIITLIVLQGFVESNYIFRDVFVTWPGNSHDARIFKNLLLYQQCLQRTFLPRTLSKNTQNTSIPPLILGDLAYPLEKFIMEPYADCGDLNLQEKRYNVALSKSRVVVENTFGKLKGRFQCLSKRLDTPVQNTVNIVAACCTLHNVFELKKQEFFEDWLQNIDIDLGKNIPYQGICRGLGLGQSMRGGNEEFH